MRERLLKSPLHQKGTFGVVTVLLLANIVWGGLFFGDQLLLVNLAAVTWTGRILEDRLGLKKYLAFLGVNYAAITLALIVVYLLLIVFSSSPEFVRMLLQLGGWPLLHSIAIGHYLGLGTTVLHAPSGLRSRHLPFVISGWAFLCALAVDSSKVNPGESRANPFFIRFLWIGGVMPSVSYATCHVLGARLGLRGPDAVGEDLVSLFTVNTSTTLPGWSDEDAKRRRAIAEAALSKKLEQLSRGAASGSTHAEHPPTNPAPAVTPPEVKPTGIETASGKTEE